MPPYLGVLFGFQLPILMNIHHTKVNLSIHIFFHEDLWVVFVEWRLWIMNHQVKLVTVDRDLCLHWLKTFLISNSTLYHVDFPILIILNILLQHNLDLDQFLYLLICQFNYEFNFEVKLLFPLGSFPILFQILHWRLFKYYS